MRGCRAFTDDEVPLMRGSFKSLRDEVLFVLGNTSGFRLSELLSIKVNHVMQFGAVVESLSVARRHMKKKIEGRTVRLHPEARKLIARLIVEEGLEPHHYLFKSRNGANRPISRYRAWAILKEAAAQNKLQGKIAAHSMRKRFANKVYNKLQRDLRKTQVALGHKNINSTVSYLAVDQQEIDDAILSI
jgi:site-specific recombinase XerD